MIHKWQKCEDKEQHVSCFIVASASHFDGHGFFFKNPLSVKERGTPNLIKHMFWRFRKKVKLPYFSLGNIVFIFFNRLYQVYPITSWFSWCFNFHSLVAKICKVCWHKLKLTPTISYICIHLRISTRPQPGDKVKLSKALCRCGAIDSYGVYSTISRYSWI